VSDFGLTKSRDYMDKNASKEPAFGSAHWTAPEILSDSDSVDYILADIYSFGIILWELLTREQPYAGLRCAWLRSSIPITNSFEIL
jgi:serine/threonine protein kinase